MRSIDEKHGVGDVVFLVKLRQKRMSENLRCCRLKLCMEEFVCLGINCGVQPVLLIVQLDHSLVTRNVIRTPTRFGL